MNRLAEASSSYLRSAADQPVDWYTWSEEAFEKAAEEDKPILLDSGAVWCHWCHVMDHESYDDPEIAEIINERFVPIKLDRDERPEVDSRYQEAVGAMTGQGGWPLTVFLTPDKKPFYGGTYFPPEPRMGRPSFRQVLESVAEQYEAKRDDVHTRAETLVGRIQARVDPTPGDVDAFYLDQGLDGLRSGHDTRHGGFGDAPKFPHPPAIELLLAEHWRTGDDEPVEIVRSTLTGMADGGIHDHLGGGFHRYATDRAWEVPHFEKMSYDNAGLAVNYADAYAVTGDQRWADVAKGIVDHVLGVSTGPALYGSQDADVGPGDDGSYWTWTPDEIREASPDHAEILIARFGVTDEGNMQHGDRTVLRVARSVEDLADDLDASPDPVRDRLAEGRKDLLLARGRREEPYVDTTPYAAWNGLSVRGVWRAGHVLDDDEACDAARETLDFVLEEMFRPDEGVFHTWDDGPRIPGLLDDNVQIGRASLLAYGSTGEVAYLDRARAIADLLLKSFQHEDGPFTDHAPDLVDAPLGTRFPVHDNPEPSPNGSAILFLDELSRTTGEPAYREAGVRVLEGVLGSTGANPQSATVLSGLWCVLRDAPTVTIRGDPDDADALHDAALAAYAPWKVVLPPGADHVPDAAEGAGPGVVVCRGRSCTRPATTVDEVRDRLGGPART